VLFVGRLLPHKGVDTLIRAMRPGRRLVLIGETYDPRYAADLRTLADGKRVEFRGARDDDELLRAYRAASCIVLPSVYTTMYGDRSNVPELLGQTLLEGMACGAPAIGTDVASLPEVVDHGVTGFIVPERDPVALGERIEWLIDHPVEARRMGAAGRERVRHRFSWDAVVGRCLAAYAPPGEQLVA
jgi:glycosyltransferase involved in cell wall biosynthesis